MVFKYIIKNADNSIGLYDQTRYDFGNDKPELLKKVIKQVDQFYNEIFAGNGSKLLLYNTDDLTELLICKKVEYTYSLTEYYVRYNLEFDKNFQNEIWKPMLEKQKNNNEHPTIEEQYNDWLFRQYKDELDELFDF